MELIEAIYLSVALFSVGAIVLFIISFTSYKVRKKLEPEDLNKKISHELKPKLEAKNGKPIQESKPHSKPVIKKEKVKIKISDDRKKELTSSNSSKFQPKPKKNIITKTEQPRIAVLNKPVIKTEAPVRKEEKPISSEDKSKKNMFDHYSDSQDDEFKSISE